MQTPFPNSKTVENSRIAQSIGMTLDRFIKNNQAEFQYASGELSQLLRDIALASKVVNREVNKAGLVDIMGHTGSMNSTGEDQRKLQRTKLHGALYRIAGGRFPPESFKGRDLHLSCH